MMTTPGSTSHIATVRRDDRGTLYLVLTPRKEGKGHERVVFALSSAVDTVKASELVKDFNQRGSLLAGGLPLAPYEVPELR